MERRFVCEGKSLRPRLFDQIATCFVYIIISAVQSINPISRMWRRKCVFRSYGHKGAALNDVPYLDIDDDHERIEVYSVDPLSDTSETTVPLEDLTDGTDSAYGSLEEGNLPELDQLTDEHLFVQGKGIKGPQSDDQWILLRNDEFLPPFDEYPILSLTDLAVDRVNLKGNQHKSATKTATATSTKSIEDTECETLTSKREIQRTQEITEVFASDASISKTTELYSDGTKEVVNDLEELSQADVEEIMPDIDVTEDYNREKIHDVIHSHRSSSIIEEPEQLNIDDLENFESNVGNAYVESIRTKSLGPLIKEELKCAIQCRRLRTGKPEITLEPEGPKIYQLSAEEIKKKNTRLQQNRKSARKSRQKSRETEEELIQYIGESEKTKTRLTESLVQLKAEKTSLLNCFIYHLDHCANTELVAKQKAELRNTYSNI